MVREDKSNEEMYPMVMFCVALSRLAYDNPVKSAHNLSILFNMTPFRNMLAQVGSLDSEGDFLRMNEGFRNLFQSGDQRNSGECEPHPFLKGKYNGRLLYKQIAAYINKATDKISKKGLSTKKIMSKVKRGNTITLSDHIKMLPKGIYGNKNIFEAESEIQLTPSKIKTYFICTINDLNCYVVHHTDFNIIFVIFRGTLSVKSAIKDIRFYRKKISTTGTPPTKEEQGEGRVHLGFLENLDQAFQRICYCIADIQKQVTGRCKVVTTGHSLGGALTTLFSYMYVKFFSKLEKLCLDLNSPVPHHRCHCVAVSAPRVGGKRFAFNFNTQMIKVAESNPNIEFLNMFNRHDVVPKVPNKTPPGYSNWTRVGNLEYDGLEGENAIILCNNSSVSPVTTHTKYKGNLKCSRGVTPTNFPRASLNPHLYVYFINFMSNLRSVNQFRPEKQYLRIIHWDGSGYKSLFITNWRCNHVLDKPNYIHEIVDGFASAINTIKFKCARGGSTCTLVHAKTDSGLDENGRGKSNSVRFRVYNRTCRERREQGPNVGSKIEAARESLDELPTRFVEVQTVGSVKSERDPGTQVVTGTPVNPPEPEVLAMPELPSFPLVSQDDKSAADFLARYQSLPQMPVPEKVGGRRRKTRKRRKRKTRGRKNNRKRKTKHRKRKTKHRRRR